MWITLEDLYALEGSTAHIFYYCGSSEKQVGMVGCTVLILHLTPPTCNHTPVYVDVGSKKGESSLAHIIHGPCLNGYSVSHRPEQGTDMGVYTQWQSVVNSVITATEVKPHLLKVAPTPIIWGKDVALGT